MMERKYKANWFLTILIALVYLAFFFLAAISGVNALILYSSYFLGILVLLIAIKYADKLNIFGILFASLIAALFFSNLLLMMPSQLAAAFVVIPNSNGNEVEIIFRSFLKMILTLKDIVLIMLILNLILIRGWQNNKEQFEVK